MRLSEWTFPRSVCGRVRVCKRACVVCVVSVPGVMTWHKVRGAGAMIRWTRVIECAHKCVIYPLRLGLTRESAARRDGSGLTRGVCRRMSPLRLGCTIGGPTRVGRVTLFRDWAHRLGPCRIRPATSTSRTRVDDLVRLSAWRSASANPTARLVVPLFPLIAGSNRLESTEYSPSEALAWSSLFRLTQPPDPYPHSSETQRHRLLSLTYRGSPARAHSLRPYVRAGQSAAPVTPSFGHAPLGRYRLWHLAV